MRAVNLIPADQRRGASRGLGRSQGASYALIALVVVLAIFGFAYGKAKHAISSSKAELASTDAQTQQVQANAASLANYEAMNAERETRLKAVESLVDSRFDWAHSMHEFGRVLPAHVSISSLTGAVGNAAGSTAAASSSSSAGKSPAAVTSATPPGSVPTFTLGGCADSQDEVAQTLERLRLIDGVKEVTLQSSTATAAGGSAAGSEGCAGTSFTAAIVFAPLPEAAAYPTAKAVADASVSTSTIKTGRTK